MEDLGGGGDRGRRMLEAGGVRDDIEIVRTRERKARYEGRHGEMRRDLAGAGERKEK